MGFIRSVVTIVVGIVLSQLILTFIVTPTLQRLGLF